jgi:transposase
MVAALPRRHCNVPRSWKLKPLSKEDGNTKDTIIEVDVAKRVFQHHGASTDEQVKFSKRLSREQFRAFMVQHTTCFVIFEACGSAGSSSVAKA